MDFKVVDLARNQVKRILQNNDWLREFEKRAGEKLREVFDQDLQDTPLRLVEQLERLRQAEHKLLIKSDEHGSATTARLSMEIQMAESVYKVIELVGTSTDSWEKAAKAAVDRAAKTVRDLRIAEVISQDLVITDGKVEAYRVKVKVSFKFEGAS